MNYHAENINILDVAADNIEQFGIYCIKDKKYPGYQKKVDWFKTEINKGLKIKIAVDSQGKQLGFIEYIPSELAWRPVKAKNYYFIQCIALFVKKEHGKKIGRTLLKDCEEDAITTNKSGICTMTSNGTWIANRTIFEKTGFKLTDKRGRFELMSKVLNSNSPYPVLNDWTIAQERYSGWNLIYSDQCPMHEKSISGVMQSARDNGIKLNVIKLNTPAEAQNGPSGFGTFALIKDGKLLSDHYISKTRFENILKKESND